jgi:SulP family sulfate permease
VLVVLLFLTGPLQYLPNAVLATIVFLIGVELIDRVGLRRIDASGHRIELAIALVTTATVVAWGVEQGIVLAIILSVIAHLRRSYSPSNSILGTKGEHDWRSAPVTPAPQAEPGLVVYRWNASLYFANAARFEEQLLALAAKNGTAVAWICIDASGIGDVDYTGGETLLETNAELKEQGVRLVFADVSRGIKRELDRSGVTAAVGEDAFFPGVDGVLAAYRSR